MSGSVWRCNRYIVSSFRVHRATCWHRSPAQAVVTYLNGGNWRIVAEYTEIAIGNDVDGSSGAAAHGVSARQPSGKAGRRHRLIMPPEPRRSSKAIRSSAGFATRTRCRNRYSRISRCSRRLAGTSSACRRVRVAAKNRGPSYRLPDLRFRHAVGLHCPGHENVDAALKNGASCQSWCANIPPRIGITAVLHTWAPIASTTRNRMTRQARTSGVPSRLRSKKRVGRERERCSFDSLLQNIGDSNHRSGKSITVNF
jgi:hypothetical protein